MREHPGLDQGTIATCLDRNYGVAIDAAALTYFRCERIVDDLAEFGESVFSNPTLGEAARAEAADFSMAVFEPDGDIDRAEIVADRWRGG